MLSLSIPYATHQKIFRFFLLANHSVLLIEEYNQDPGSWNNQGLYNCLSLSKVKVKPNLEEVPS